MGVRVREIKAEKEKYATKKEGKEENTKTKGKKKIERNKK